MYITGENDTLATLQGLAECQLPADKFKQEFIRLNPHFVLSEDGKFPSFFPVNPVGCQSSAIPVDAGLYKEVGEFTLSERQTLRKMQENSIEPIPILVAQEIVEQYNTCMASIAQVLDRHETLRQILAFINDSIDWTHTFDFMEQGFLYRSKQMQHLPIYKSLEAFEQNMMEMDRLQAILYSMRNKKGGNAAALRFSVQQKVKELGIKVRQQIYAKSQDSLYKHLRSSYNKYELRLMSHESWRKGKQRVIELDLLNRTSLGKIRKLIPVLQDAGEAAGKVGTIVSIGSLLMETHKASHKGMGNAIRTAAGGTANLVVSEVVMVIGIGVGTTMLVSTPLGWLVIVGGVVGGAVAGNVSQKGVEAAYDKTSPIVKRYLDKVSYEVGAFFNGFVNEMMKQQIRY